jgi:hypothetical protein
MKKIFLVFGLILFLSNTFAREYHPFVDTTKMWSAMRTAYPQGIQETYFTRFGGDTVINKTTYNKVLETTDTLLQNWELIGTVREEPGSKTVYYRDLNGNEGKLYDFNMQAGDTLEITNYYYGPTYSTFTYSCMSVDSILINGQYHNSYVVRFLWTDNKEKYSYETWIEGIGCDYGALASGFCQVMGNTYGLLCYYENDVLIYNTPLNQCKITGDICPYLPEQTLDTAYVGEYYEYQFQSSPCPSDSIQFYEYSLPPGLGLDLYTGLLYGTPHPNAIHQDYVSIYIINWKYTTEWKDFPITILEPLGIDNKKFEKQIRIDCMVRGNNLLITTGSNSTLNEITDLQIYNSVGVKIFAQRLPGNHELVNVAAWPRGVYIAVIYSNGGAVGKCKFVVG